METSRSLTASEASLMTRMLAGVRADLIPQLSNALVTPMSDGGMGSLRFLSERADRHFGEQVVEFEFQDADGVSVSATINVDDQGRLYELDLFKADLSPLKNTPEI